ncbi:MAG: ribosome biogenesis GTPase Der [SAR324 cluster bacterium]|nr:ribosome biogenesis GTPase Der [SAR324 cluster bacterium]
MKKKLPVISIIGRPNVGKSSFLNKVQRKRTAIVDDMPGVTRDRNYAIINYDDYEFILVDTAGMDNPESSFLSAQIHQQIEAAIEESDAIIVMSDVNNGWTSYDNEMLYFCKKFNKPVFLVVNKVDNEKRRNESYEFFNSGEKINTISCAHNIGIEQLLEDINQIIPLKAVETNDEDEDSCHIAIVGKPNAGKSSLVNMILGQQRMIVGDEAGTTRDSVDVKFKYQDKNFVLIDTAGIKKKMKVNSKIEHYSIVTSIKSIERSDIVLLIIDSVEGITDQVMRIAGDVSQRKKGIIIIFNKIDLLALENYKKTLLDDFDYKMKFVDYAPIVFVSAKNGENMNNIFKAIDKVRQQLNRHIKTHDFNEILIKIVNRHQPSIKGPTRVKIFYGSQIKSKPPTFVLKTNHPDRIDEAYKKYIIHQIRHHFDFTGCPIELILKN